MPHSDHEVTALLQAYTRGETAALGPLMTLMYGKLRAIAGSQLKRVGSRGTLSPTALVHEVFLYLYHRKLDVKSRSHFVSILAKCMRWLIIGYARERGAGKRGGGRVRLCFNEGLHSPVSADVSMAELSASLEKLARLDPELSRVVELRFLVGLGLEETADTLGISINTVKRRWKTAKLWLASELGIGSSQAS